MKVSSDILPKRLLAISAEINQAGGAIYLVGGWVRDLLLDTPSHDYDLEVYGLDMEQLFNILVRHAKPNLVGKSFGIIRHEQPLRRTYWIPLTISRRV